MVSVLRRQPLDILGIEQLPLEIVTLPDGLPIPPLAQLLDVGLWPHAISIDIVNFDVVIFSECRPIAVCKAPRMY